MPMSLKICQWTLTTSTFHNYRFLSGRSRSQIVCDINRVNANQNIGQAYFLVEIPVIKRSISTISAKSAEIICLAHRSVKFKGISKICLMHVLHIERNNISEYGKIQFLNLEIQVNRNSVNISQLYYCERAGKHATI